MRISLCISFALVCGSLFAQSDEPIKFRGAFIGEPLSDLVDCSSRKPISLKEGFKVHGKICEGGKGVLASVHAHFVGAEEGTIFMFDNRTLFRIEILVPNNDWDKVRYDLSTKLGEPQSEVPDVYQNGFGARWEFNKGFWQKDHVVAYAGEKVLSASVSGPTGYGITINITDDRHAKTPESTANSLD